MAGLTLEQLQSMGAVPKTTPAIKPVSVPVQGTNVPTTKPSLGGGLTLEQLQKMGAKPKPVQSVRDQRIAAGLPVGAGERAEPTLGGSIVRDIAAIPIKTAMSVARPFYDPLGKKGGKVMKSKYLGDVTDFGTQIENKADVLADKYKKGEISLGRAALGGVGAGAQAGLDVAQLVPIDAIGVAGAKVIAGTVPKIAENVIARTAGKAMIPTIKTTAKESVIRGGATAGAYDVAGQLASGEKYNPGQTAVAVGMGTAFDFGASKVLPEVFHGVKNTVGRLNPKNAQERLVNKAEQEIFDIQNNYAKTRKKMDYSKDALVSNRRRVAASGVLTDTVDDTGIVRTTQPGGAADKYREMVIDGNESLVRDSLAKEGRSVNPAVLARELKAEVEQNGLIKGKAKLQALRDVDTEIQGYARDNAGNIPLTEIHDAKIATTKIIKDFATPAEHKTYQKSLASGLKKTVEKYSSADIQNINKELSKYYQDLDLIESLDGKRVRGGKLGKYFYQIAGNISGGAVGSIFGPIGGAVGAVVGGEVSSGLKGSAMRKTFGKIPLSAPEKSAVLEAAKMNLNKPRLELPAPSAVEPKPMGTFTTGQGTIQLPDNLAKANAEEMAIRQAQANLPPTGVPPAYSAYPEKYVPEQNLPIIDAGPTPRPLKANLPTVKEPPSVYSPQPDPLKAFVNEPYVAPEKLPTIQMGPKPKAPKANIPTIQMKKAPLPKVAVPEKPKPKPTLSLKKKTITKPTIEFDPKTGVVTDPKKAIEAAKEFVKKNGAQNGMYAFGGITVDDNGDISYDPKQAAAFMAAGMIGQSKASQEMFRGFADLSLKTLERMVGRSRVSKQFILDILKQQDVVKAEKDIMENILKDFGPEVSVKEFANKVKTELLPLKRRSSIPSNIDTDSVDTYLQAKNKYPGQFAVKFQKRGLPDELRGNVKNYSEHLYDSPIKTKAGDKHFGNMTDNYFAHTRIEDMADGKTRRVIEVQSDLMQKGNLDIELNVKPKNYPYSPITPAKPGSKRYVEISKLKPYEEDWYKRIIPEEVKAAAQDGKKRVLFPTGETAMKIEGLGQGGDRWVITDQLVNGMEASKLTPEKMKVGQNVKAFGVNGDWVITEVIGNGKFKAISKNMYESKLRPERSGGNASDDAAFIARHSETFDISERIDPSNPIYRFYEGDVKKYLKRFDAKEIVDENGVSWVEVPITEDMKDMPVGAFGYISPADRPKANIPKVKPKTTVSKDPLIEEAKKYKSAEEFIKSQGETVYHSSSEKFANGKPNFDAYFGDTDWKKAFAKEFGVNEYEVVLPKNKKILDLNKNTPEANSFIEKWGGSREDFYDEDWVDKYKVFPEVKKSGYDGAKFQGEYILSKDLINEIKTKSELEDIWNKANKSLNLPKKKEYRYHETSIKNLESIKKQGLKPSMGMYGKGVYFSPEIGIEESAGSGLIIRANKASLKDFDFDEFVSDTGKIREGWADKQVPPEILEYSIDNGKTWELLNKPVTLPKAKITIEEIIKSKPIKDGVVQYDNLYHGSTKKGLSELSPNASQRTVFGAKAVVSATENKNLAKSFLRGELGDKTPGSIYNVQGPFKIIDVGTPKGKELWQSFDKDPEKALLGGYDGIQHQNYEELKVKAFYKDIDPSSVVNAKEIQLFKPVKVKELK